MARVRNPEVGKHVLYGKIGLAHKVAIKGEAAARAAGHEAAGLLILGAVGGREVARHPREEAQEFAGPEDRSHGCRRGHVMRPTEKYILFEAIPLPYQGGGEEEQPQRGWGRGKTDQTDRTGVCGM